MKIEHYKKQKLKKDIERIAGNYLDLCQYKLFFFGSRVIGNNISRSDIDIGIEGDKPIPMEIFTKIKEDISNLLVLYRIDIVDFSMVDKDFYKVAKQKIEMF
jgi:predicted nucleotidyltransferase